MNIKQTFQEHNYLAIVNNAEEVISAEDRLILGMSLYRLGRYDQALDVFGELSDEARLLVKSLFFMGKIYQQKGDMDAAQHCIERYLVFYPDDDEAGDIIQAPKDNAELMSLPSADLAQIYAQQGHFEEALDIFLDLLKDSPDADIREAALKIQDMFIEKTLGQWLEKVRK